MSAIDDQADVERVLAGDISAFEGIVRRWQGPLINLAYRFFRDRGRAEEMAQEAFLRAYRASPVAQDAVFSTWLFALATNLYRSELRRIPARTVPLEDIADPWMRAPPTEVSKTTTGDLRCGRSGWRSAAEVSRALILFLFPRHGRRTAARSLGCLRARSRRIVSRDGNVRSKLPQRSGAAPERRPDETLDGHDQIGHERRY